MAFLSIPSSWLAVGASLKQQIFTTIKDNFDNHETRIGAIELGASKVNIFNFEVGGYLAHYSTSELVGIGSFKAYSACTISDVKIILTNTSSSPSSSSSAGTLSIDLQKSTDNGATWVSMFSTKPSIGAGTSATGSSSTTYTFVTGANVLAFGDLVRLDIYSKKTTQGSFLVEVYGDL